MSITGFEAPFFVGRALFAVYGVKIRGPTPPLLPPPLLLLSALAAAAEEEEAKAVAADEEEAEEASGREGAVLVTEAGERLGMEW